MFKAGHPYFQGRKAAKNTGGKRVIAVDCLAWEWSVVSYPMGRICI